ncbi:hypothetical protein NE237_000819 [Protea cynaroides]|uniref:Uncharacterized protein n=1 Tax=Protea cynaroides TaxID=273540 RepID=A0A9Q0KRZ6_9MAGN|nr:hypothetical protein NE237_000819 [Protea cynaroides]
MAMEGEEANQQVKWISMSSIVTSMEKLKLPSLREVAVAGKASKDVGCDRGTTRAEKGSHRLRMSGQEEVHRHRRLPGLEKSELVQESIFNRSDCRNRTEL